MIKTYEIIKDEAELRRFIDWLPDCKENEQFYACLFMRKKYCPEVPWIKSDKGQLKRLTATKDRLFDKIAQLECKVGSYTFDGNPVPQESLALYITTNPRDLWKATVRSIGQLAKVLECSGKNSNPHQEVMSEIQRTTGTRKYITFDIDEKNKDNLKAIMDLTGGCCDVMETRGGYHVHVHKDKTDYIGALNKMWYVEIAKYADVSGDMMSPVGGTYQGGHTVRFIHRYTPDNNGLDHLPIEQRQKYCHCKDGDTHCAVCPCGKPGHVRSLGAFTGMWCDSCYDFALSGK